MPYFKTTLKSISQSVLIALALSTSNSTWASPSDIQNAAPDVAASAVGKAVPDAHSMLPSYWRTKDFRHFAEALTKDTAQATDTKSKIVVYRLASDNARKDEKGQPVPYSLFFNGDYQASLLPSGFTVQEICPGPNKLAVSPDMVDRAHPQALPDLTATAKQTYFFEAVQGADGKVQFVARDVKDLGDVGHLQMHTIPRVLQKPCTPAKRPLEKLTIGGDGFFAFDKAGFNDIQPTGQEKLRNLLAQMKNDFESITIVRIEAHTDRFGSVAYNADLSQRRANTVLKYFEDNGINTMHDARGVGSGFPVVFCPGPRTQAVTDCLYPNRRMEIFIEGVRKPGTSPSQ